MSEPVRIYASCLLSTWMGEVVAPVKAVSFILVLLVAATWFRPVTDDRFAVHAASFRVAAVASEHLLLCIRLSHVLHDYRMFCNAIVITLCCQCCCVILPLSIIAATSSCTSGRCGPSLECHVLGRPPRLFSWPLLPLPGKMHLSRKDLLAQMWLGGRRVHAVGLELLVENVCVSSLTRCRHMSGRWRTSRASPPLSCRHGLECGCHPDLEVTISAFGMLPTLIQLKPSAGACMEPLPRGLDRHGRS